MALEPSYGVQDDLVDHYALVTSESIFKCLSSNVSIFGSRVNDDYCDCQDGTDEPGTSACASPTLFVKLSPEWKFRCKNVGFKPQEIPHNRINDGLCDCCDGSDEYFGDTKCPNVCGEVQEMEEKRRIEEEQIRQVGIQKKEQMLERALKNRENEKIKSTIDMAEVKNLEKELEEKALQLLSLEKEEEEEKQRLIDAYNVAFEAWKVEKAKNQTNKMNGTVHLFSNCIRWGSKDMFGHDEETPYGEEEILEENKTCDEVIPSSESGFCECFNNVTESVIKYNKEDGHASLQCSYVCANAGEDGLDIFEMDDGSSFQLPAAKDMRAEVEKIRERIGELSSSIEEVQMRLNRTINTEDILRTLSGTCFSLDFMSYTYELCPFKDAHQYNIGTKDGPCMGKWGKFGNNTYSLWSNASDFTNMIFEYGDKCWNDKYRLTTVHVICGSEDKLVQVEETFMCNYAMVFQTPAICE